MPTAIRPPAGPKLNPRWPLWAQPPAPAWSPKSIPGLIAWWDFSSLGLADGTAISSVADLSDAGNNLSSGISANFPTCKTGIQNGLAIARFDGSNDTLPTASIPLPPTQTIFAVASLPNTSINFPMLVSQSSSQMELRYNGNTGKPEMGGVGSSTAVATNVAGTGFHRIAGTWDQLGGALNIYDDVPETNSGSDTGAINATGVINIGSRGGGSFFFNGDLGEILIYNTVLSATVRQQVESYLDFKWFAHAPTVYNQSTSGTLSFTGAQVKQTSRTQTATLDFVAALTKRTSRALTAALNFTGSLAPSHLFTKALTATLSFTGNLIKATSRVQTATLSFTGAMTKQTARAFTATISFAGAIAKRTSRALTATLSFTGAQVKRTSRAVSGVLSFAGTLATSSTGHFTQAFTATLSFAGAQAKSTSRSLAAALSFTGAMPKGSTRALTASVGFAGSLVKKTGKALTAALSFAGSVARTGGTVVSLPLTLTIRDMARTAVQILTFGRTTAMTNSQAVATERDTDTTRLQVKATDASRVTATISDGLAN